RCLVVDGCQLARQLRGEPDVPDPARESRLVPHVRALRRVRHRRDRIRSAPCARNARQVARTDRGGLAGCRVKPPRWRLAGVVVAIVSTAAPAFGNQRTGWMTPPQEEIDTTWGILDPHSLFDWNEMREEKSLTGGWGGERSRLREAGIGF